MQRQPKTPVLPLPTQESAKMWRRISDDWYKYSFEVPTTWAQNEEGVTPDRLTLFSEPAVVEEVDPVTLPSGLMKLDFSADPLAKPDPQDVSGWEAIMVAGTSGWMKITQGGEASGPYDTWTGVYIPGSEYRYTLSLLCAPPGGDEAIREQFIGECQGVLEHILTTFQIIP